MTNSKIFVGYVGGITKTTFPNYIQMLLYIKQTTTENTVREHYLMYCGDLNGKEVQKGRDIYVCMYVCMYMYMIMYMYTFLYVCRYAWAARV